MVQTTPNASARIPDAPGCSPDGNAAAGLTSGEGAAPEPYLRKVLRPPTYGYVRDGALVTPSVAVLFRELAARLNVFATRKNWVAAFSWFSSGVLVVPLLVFFVSYFSLPLLLLGAFYGLVGLGSHGTLYYHRYGTHRAYKFRNGFVRFVVENLAIKLIVDEVYVVSHHVHHLLSEQPGDPYNVKGGFFYCFLADANHQGVNRELDEADYAKMSRLLAHTGVRRNSFAEYQVWGSIAHPLHTIAAFAANWVGWYTALWLVGGHALATAIFGGAFVWAFGVRTFNYDGHGAGEDKRRDGIDFGRDDRSINQLWPGIVAGEWHNNHHLYPTGARSGFLPYQLDLPWLFIRSAAAIGAITSYRDPKAQFLRRYYEPWLAARAAAASPPVNVPADVDT